MSLVPKVKKPDPPSATPSLADSTVQVAGDQANQGYSSLINTGPQGLQRKATVAKRSLIGG